MDENIKFTMELSSKETPFLDFCIHIENAEIKTDIYHKNTDTFNYNWTSDLAIHVIAKKTFLSIWQDVFVTWS